MVRPWTTRFIGIAGEDIPIRSADFCTAVWKETQGNDPVDTSPLQPNAISSVTLNNVGSDAVWWNRYRDVKVGSLKQIRKSGSSEYRWKSTRTRGAGHRLRRINVDGQSYTILHDGIGRATLTLDFELKYDAANRLTEAYNPSTGAFEYYAYDGQGRLAYVYNSEDNAAQHFGYDGARMIVSMDESFGLLWQSFQGPSLDLILEFHDANQAVIPIIDHRKSIAGAWDITDGFMVGIATYDAEGRVAQYSNDEALECNEIGNPGMVCNAPGGLPFGLNARWRSPMTGFVNMHHRWYSPRMGEFLSHDPLGYIDSYNLFGFATFDSINGYDPFGLSTDGHAGDNILETFWKQVKQNPKNMMAYYNSIKANPEKEKEDFLNGLVKGWVINQALSPAALLLTKPSGDESPESLDAALRISPKNRGEDLGITIATLGVGRLTLNLLSKSSKKIAKSATDIYKVWKKGPNWRSGPQFGHTFTKHGAGKKNTNSLKDTSRDSGHPEEGQWLDNQKAAEIMGKYSNKKTFSQRTIEVDIPPGLGQVIKPDGSIVQVTRARLVPNKTKTGFRSGFPILE